MEIKLFHYEHTLPPGTGEGIRLLTSLMNVEIENRNNIFPVIEHLDRGGSVIIIANHRSHADHGIIVDHVVAQFRQHVQQIVGVAGIKLFPHYYDKTLTEAQKIQYGDEIEHHEKTASEYDGLLLEAAAKAMKITIVPTPQEEHITNDAWGGLNLRLAVKAMDKFQEYMEQDRAIGLFYPEGTRVKTTEGIRAKGGMNRFIQRDFGDHIMIWPIGITGSKDVLPKHGGIRNIRSLVKTYLGTPFFPQEIRDEYMEYSKVIKHEDLLMARIFDVLPVKYWGEYLADQRFMDYYNRKNPFPVNRVLFDAKETANGG